MNLTLMVWRQKGPDTPGKLEQYEAGEISEEMSFLEMLDEVNEELIKKGELSVPADVIAAEKNPKNKDTDSAPLEDPSESQEIVREASELVRTPSTLSQFSTLL